MYDIVMNYLVYQYKHNTFYQNIIMLPSYIIDGHNLANY